LSKGRREAPLDAGQASEIISTHLFTSKEHVYTMYS